MTERQSQKPKRSKEEKLERLKAKARAKAKAKAEAEAKAKELWERFSTNYQDEKIALAEAVKILNKWIKRPDCQKWRTAGYKVKDHWIKSNEVFLNSFTISRVFPGDPYKELYAYEFNINGTLFRFHSFLKLRKLGKCNLESYGSAEPLSNAEVKALKTSVPVLIRMVELRIGFENSNKKNT